MKSLLHSKELRRAAISQLLYVVFNLLLAVASLLAVWLLKAPWLAIVLVVISKWRVLAVKPRFWWANIQSNVVDLVVGLSFVAWLSQINGQFWPMQIALTLLYIFWLLVVKPQSSKRMIIAQGLAATYLGISAVFLIGYNWHILLVTTVSFIIMFCVARHILGAYDDQDELFYSGLWGIFGAELAWIFHHWALAYPIVFLKNSGLQLVQAAIILTVLTFLASVCFDCLFGCRRSSDKTWQQELGVPIIFSVLIILVLLLFLSQPLSGSI